MDFNLIVGIAAKLLSIIISISVIVLLVFISAVTADYIYDLRHHIPNQVERGDDL